jgi:hypothetical protein
VNGRFRDDDNTTASVLPKLSFVTKWMRMNDIGKEGRLVNGEHLMHEKGFGYWYS